MKQRDPGPNSSEPVQPLEVVGGVYTDLHTRRLVFNEMEIPASEAEKLRVRKKYFGETSAKGFTQFSREWKEYMLQEPPDTGEMVPVDFFDIPNEIEGQSPYEVLGVPEGDIVAAHRAYKMFAREWHPDKVRGRIENLEKETSGGPSVWETFLGRMESTAEWTEGAPKTLSEEELSMLPEEKKEAYKASHQAWRGAKPKSRKEFLIDEMVAVAEAKIRVVNQAWEMIRKGLSYETLTGIGSMWETIESETSNHFWLYPIQKISLKGDGEIVRQLRFMVTDEGELVFDGAGRAQLDYAYGFDKEFGIYEMFREAFPLKLLFAFFDYRSGRMIHPALLVDIAEEFGLDMAQMNLCRNLLYTHAGSEEICRQMNITPRFYSPKNTDGSFLISRKYIEEIIDKGMLSAEQKNKLTNGTYTGYSEATLDAFTQFVLSAQKEYEQDEKYRKNEVAYELVKERGITFLEAKGALKGDYRGNKSDEVTSIYHTLLSVQSAPARFRRRMKDIQTGPTYTLDEDPKDEFTVGVEYGRDGLRLILPEQEGGRRYDYLKTREAFFGTADMEIMKQVAYGTSVGNAKKTQKIGGA